MHGHDQPWPPVDHGTLLEVPVQLGLIIRGAAVELNDQPSPRACVLKTAVGTFATLVDARGAGHGRGDNQRTFWGDKQPLFPPPGASVAGMIFHHAEPWVVFWKQSVNPIVCILHALKPVGGHLPKVVGILDRMIRGGSQGSAPGEL